MIGKLWRTRGRGEEYPLQVESEEDKRRWDLAMGIALQVFPEPELRSQARAMASVLFASDHPT